MSILKTWGGFNDKRKDFLTYLTRIRKDGGTMLRPDLTEKLFESNRQLAPVTKLMWSAVGAISPRVTGVNTFVQKGYDMTPRTKLYGDELVANGVFGSSANWTPEVSWSISSGTANCVGGQASTKSVIYTGTPFIVSGKLYLVTYTILNYSQGTFKVTLEGGGIGVGQSRTGSGTYSEILPSAGNGAIYLQSTSGTFVGSIDNISVREVLTNDLTQATAASQPDFSRIAPVERGGLMNANGQTKFMTFPTISFGASDAWTAEYVLNWNGNNLASNLESIGTLSIQSSGVVTFYNGSSSVSSVNKLKCGKRIVLTAIGKGSNVDLYVDGVFFESLTKTITASFSGVGRNAALASFNSLISHIALFSKAISPSEVATRSAVLRQIYPEIDSVPIGTQTWAVRNAEMACSCMGNLIPEVTLAATWATSQTLYDNAYAATSGTTEQKMYAGVKAAAMWCHYNNDAALGAIYGKLYNWFAVKLIQMDIDYYNAANPNALWGWRIPAQADFTTLQTTLGGASVAGGKLKALGTSYWTTPNTGATNEVGFTALGVGTRKDDGIVALFNTYFIMWGVDGYTMYVRHDVLTSTITNAVTLPRGYSLRLIKT